MINKQTFMYKVVGDCAIRADVYKQADNTTQPVIIFIHGGAFNDPLIIIEMLANAGYTVVSIDYRLAPETKLKNIIEDIQDAFGWVRAEGRERFNIDPNRIGVVGNSAGGYLTLMSGFIIDPPPKVLVSMYGYGDIDEPWYSKPDPFTASSLLSQNQPHAQRSELAQSLKLRYQIIEGYFIYIVVNTVCGLRK